MKYTVFNKVTGEIEKNITCSENLILLQYDSEIYSHIEGEFDYFLYYIQDNEPVLIPTKPSEHHIFDYVNKQWFDPRTIESEWVLVREQRNKLLAVSDWTQLPDVPLSTKNMWAEYRQALRDVTLQPDPFNISWPVQPS